MITTPQAQLEKLTIKMMGWKNYTYATALADAQTIIDQLLIGTWAETVCHHPMTEWVANHFGVHWKHASFATAPFFCDGGPINPPSEDPCIVWADPGFTSEIVDNERTYADPNIYFYEGANGKTEPPYTSSAGYYIDRNNLGWGDVIAEDCTPFSTDEFILKFQIVEVVSGDGLIQLNYTQGRENQFWEMFRLDLRCTEAEVGGPRQEIVMDVTVARWDGTGDPNAGTANPVAGSESTVRLRIVAQVLP